MKEDFHKYVTRGKWPVTDKLVAPSMPKGSNFSVNLTVPVKEDLWEAIDRHVKALGVPKARWCRHQLLSGMQEEQEYFFKKSKE